MTQLRSGIAKLGRLVRVFLVSAFGRWHWEAPPWTRATANRTQVLFAHPAAAASFAGAVVVLGAIAAWYLTRPTPHYVTYEITPPGLTEYNNDGISSIKPMLVAFSESAAPLKLVKRQVTEGIALSPAVPGAWFWLSDRELHFTPKDDWPVDGAFTVKLSTKGVLADQVTLEDYKFEFASQPFVARITNGQFYQDPVDPNLN